MEHPGLHFLVAEARGKDMPWSLWASRALGLNGRNGGPFADPPSRTAEHSLQTQYELLLLIPQGSEVWDLVQNGGWAVLATPLVLGALGASRAAPGSQRGLSFQACRYGHVQHLEHLLFYGADMGAQNASGNTALHICALYNQVSEQGSCPTPSITTWAPGPGLC